MCGPHSLSLTCLPYTNNKVLSYSCSSEPHLSTKPLKWCTNFNMSYKLPSEQKLSLKKCSRFCIFLKKTNANCCKNLSSFVVVSWIMTCRNLFCFLLVHRMLPVQVSSTMPDFMTNPRHWCRGPIQATALPRRYPRKAQHRLLNDLHHPNGRPLQAQVLPGVHLLHQFRLFPKAEPQTIRLVSLKTAGKVEGMVSLTLLTSMAFHLTRYRQFLSFSSWVYLLITN